MQVDNGMFNEETADVSIGAGGKANDGTDDETIGDEGPTDVCNDIGEGSSAAKGTEIPSRSGLYKTY